jgi:hypothetical protein
MKLPGQNPIVNYVTPTKREKLVRLPFRCLPFSSIRCLFPGAVRFAVSPPAHDICALDQLACPLCSGPPSWGEDGSGRRRTYEFGDASFGEARVAAEFGLVAQFECVAALVAVNLNARREREL